jgi:Tfp pilus assembly protein PilV
MAKTKRARKKRMDNGATLIELMISMLILAVGLAALTPLYTGSMTTDNRNSKDTSAALLAQKVVEELTAQNTNSTVALTLTDCAGNTWTVPSTQGAPFANGGEGAALATSSTSLYYGGIDFTQSLSSVPAGFSMQYVDCDMNTGGQTTYDVRWNVATITANSTRLITASAQRKGNAQGGGLSFAVPITLRAIGAI